MFVWKNRPKFYLFIRDLSNVHKTGLNDLFTNWPDAVLQVKVLIE